MSGRGFRGRRLTWLLLDAAAVGGVLHAAATLGGVGRPAKEAIWLWGAFSVALLGARVSGWWRPAERAWNWQFFARAVPLLALAAWAVGARGTHGLTAGELAYLGAAALAVGAGFHLLREALESREDDGFEAVRLALLGCGAGWVFRPFLTPQMVGGLDAHWYGHIMIDALQQARAGVWPVFVGQGELMFNGAVHPFRTAPYHHHFGIALDLLTARALTPLAVQHLTVIVTAVIGSLTCYASMVALAPTRRWLAWALALGYVSGPALAGAIYAQEMYMTFMAYAWLPVVIHGNIRLVRNNDATGWLVLTAGLALVWTCHAPVGAWASIFTAGVQGMRLLAKDFDLRSWRLAAGAAVLFGGLTGYYFFSIGELAPTNAGGAGALLAYGAGALLGVAALVRLLASGRWRWLGVGALALALLWPTHRMYFGGLAAALLLGAGFVSLEWWLPWLKVRTRLPECVAAALLGGGLLAALVFPERDAARLIRSGQAFALMAQLFPKNFQSVSWLAQQLGDLQPGYGVLAALGAGLLAMLVRPTWEVRLTALGGLGLALMIFPVPRVTALLYQAVPDPLYGICTVSLWLRVMPVLVTVAIFAGFLAATNLPRGFWLRAAAGLAAAELLIGHWCETGKFIWLGERSVNSSERTAAFYRPENAQLYSYAYNGLPHPGYLMNGVVDYHLESRLLEVKTLAWRKDPVLEKPGGSAVIFSTSPGPEGADWHRLAPSLTIAPGERRLLNFEFLDRPYSGTLVMKGPGFYRDYYLPDGGFYAKSFGSAPERPKTLAVWNSGEAERQVVLSFLNVTPEETGKPFGDFARIALRSYRTEELQIQTRGLIPYRADVELTEPMYLETPRVFIPGYRARVDGISKKVEMSPDHLAMVRIEPGHHTVDVFYTGTFAARMIFRFSALVWLGLAGYGLWRVRGRLVEAESNAAGYG